MDNKARNSNKKIPMRQDGSGQWVPAEKAHKKTACEERGHLWMSTTASNFRYCDRSDCKRTERLDGSGQWVLVEKAIKQKNTPAPQAAPTLNIWDACDNSGVHCIGDTLPRTSIKDFWTQGATITVYKACGKPWLGTYCRSCGSTEMPVQETTRD